MGINDFDYAEAGCMQELKKIFDRYGRSVYFYILEQTENRELAKKLTVEVFADIYKSIQQNRKLDSMEVILRKFADHKIRNIRYAQADVEQISVHFKKHEDLAKVIEDLNEPVPDAEPVAEAPKQDSTEEQTDSQQNYDWDALERAVEESKAIKKSRKGLAPGWIVLIVIGSVVGGLFLVNLYFNLGMLDWLKNIVSEASAGLESFFQTIG